MNQDLHRRLVAEGRRIFWEATEERRKLTDAEGHRFEAIKAEIEQNGGDPLDLLEHAAAIKAIRDGRSTLALEFAKEFADG